MSALPQTSMTVDEFLVWAEGQPGRYELVDGVVYAMSPESAKHAGDQGVSARRPFVRNSGTGSAVSRIARWDDGADRSIHIL